MTVISIIVSILGTVLDGLKEDWRKWRSEEDSRPFRLQHC